MTDGWIPCPEQENTPDSDLMQTRKVSCFATISCIPESHNPQRTSKMTESQQKSELHTQLWNVADTLRGKMNADEFSDA